MRISAIAILLFAALAAPPSPVDADDARGSTGTVGQATGRLAARAQNLSRRVQGQLGDARDGGHRETVACYDGVLSQINSAARYLDHYRTALRRAGVVGGRHRLMMRTFSRRLAELDRLATECGGADAPAPGQTIVEVTVERADRAVVVHSYRMPARN